MKGYDPKDAQKWILSKMDHKLLKPIEAALPKLIDDFIQYDLHFMRLTGVLNEDDCQGNADYDEDEAFEYIYDAYISDHPDDEDEDMLAAAALNQYMALQNEYLQAHGLAD